MKKKTRYSLAFIGGATAAFVIAQVMILLISADFEAQDKSEVANFEINPEVEDIKPALRKTKISKLEKVVTPPPPPRIAQADKTQPTEEIASLSGAIPIFDPPEIDPQTFPLTVSDRDAQPVVRIAPIMPPRADKSGRCKVSFDVSPEGQPYNVAATNCTQNLFKNPTIKSVQEWKYSPKIVGGRAVARTGVQTEVIYKLTDERGKPIPE